mmetsp:Transcript_17030/g.57169  ORF Transcript_17030/g.57169 Transcript_17030/m.57169 type:complete len:479 (-) Transcript_17030:28-1464(-)
MRHLLDRSEHVGHLGRGRRVDEGCSVRRGGRRGRAGHNPVRLCRCGAQARLNLAAPLGHLAFQRGQGVLLRRGYGGGHDHLAREHLLRGLPRVTDDAPETRAGHRVGRGVPVLRRAVHVRVLPALHGHGARLGGAPSPEARNGTRSALCGDVGPVGVGDGGQEGDHLVAEACRPARERERRAEQRLEGGHLAGVAHGEIEVSRLVLAEQRPQHRPVEGEDVVGGLVRAHGAVADVLLHVSEDVCLAALERGELEVPVGVGLVGADAHHARLVGALAVLHVPLADAAARAQLFPAAVLAERTEEVAQAHRGVAHAGEALARAEEGQQLLAVEAEHLRGEGERDPAARGRVEAEPELLAERVGDRRRHLVPALGDEVRGEGPRGAEAHVGGNDQGEELVRLQHRVHDGGHPVQAALDNAARRRHGHIRHHGRRHHRPGGRRLGVPDDGHGSDLGEGPLVAGVPLRGRVACRAHRGGRGGS